MQTESTGVDGQVAQRESATGWHGLAAGELDAIDREIVRSLQNDGRAAITAIAKEIGLSYAGTRQRLQKLFEEGILRVNAVTNPRTHGYHRQALISVKTNGSSRKIAEVISTIPEAFYVAHCIGSVDVVAELIARDDAHLAELIETVRMIDGVVGAEALLYVELVKWSYLPDFVDPSPQTKTSSPAIRPTPPATPGERPDPKRARPSTSRRRARS